jgi:hypothetical protein
LVLEDDLLEGIVVEWKIYLKSTEEKFAKI